MFEHRKDGWYWIDRHTGRAYPVVRLIFECEPCRARLYVGPHQFLTRSREDAEQMLLLAVGQGVPYEIWDARWQDAA